MAKENFLTYAITDPNGHISRTAERLTFTNLNRDEIAHATSDKGVAYFEGDIEIWLDFKITVSVDTYAIAHLWTLANLKDSWYGLTVAGSDGLSIRYEYYIGPPAKRVIWLMELDGGSLYSSPAFEISLNTPYYLRMVRDESVGTYGTIYCYIYSDPARTIPLGTRSLTLHGPTKDFRYLYGIQTGEYGGNKYVSGYVENLDLQIPREQPEAMGVGKGFDFRGKGFRV